MAAGQVVSAVSAVPAGPVDVGDLPARRGPGEHHGFDDHFARTLRRARVQALLAQDPGDITAGARVAAQEFARDFAQRGSVGFGGAVDIGVAFAQHMAVGDALAFAPAAGTLAAGTLSTGTLATGTDERANADAGAMATRARKAAGRSRRTGASTGQWGRRYWAPAPPPARPPTAGGSSAARPAAKSDRWRVRPNECPAVADPSLPGESFRENRS